VKTWLLLAASASLLALSSVVSAELTPARDIEQLVSDADIIVLGTIADVTDLGLSSIEGTVGGSGARLVTGRIAIRQVLKGTVENPKEVVFWGTVWNGPTARWALAPNQDSIVFLKHGASHTDFVSPYYPALTIVGRPRVAATDPLAGVTEAVAAALHMLQSSAEARRQAVYALKGLRMPAAVAGLRAALHDRNRWTRLEAAAALLSINEIEALPLVEAELLQPRQPDSGVMLNLRVSLRRLEDAAAVPALTRLLARGDTLTRREAASGLGNMRTPAALRALGRALDDEDFDVRLNAVRSLAVATGRNQVLFSREKFQDEEARYITGWKARLRSQSIDLP
jgi:hypothetical protein